MQIIRIQQVNNAASKLSVGYFETLNMPRYINVLLLLISFVVLNCFYNLIKVAVVLNVFNF